MLNDVQPEHIREFQYLGSTLNKTGLDVANVNEELIKGRVAASKRRMLVCGVQRHCMRVY